ncbi:MAG: adenylosuccinate synthase [Phycisphaerales bacterium]
MSGTHSGYIGPLGEARASAVVGLQWGDEGKGKVVDLLAAGHDAVVRYNGGANAGHSVVVGGTRFSLHLVPSGILHAGKPAVIGNGVVVDPERLLEEIDGLTARGVDVSGLVVSDRAHVVTPYHKVEDLVREELLSKGTTEQIGTTRRGIGPAYAEKAQRSCAIRMGDLVEGAGVLRERVERAWAFKADAIGAMAARAGVKVEVPVPAVVAARLGEQGERLRGRITDTTYLLHDLVGAGRRVLFEGANATLLDVDHGTYPFVTASSCAALGIGPGTGVPERCLREVIGVMKAYSTRVGRGPLPSELHDELGNRIRERGREYGTTTGRPRRVGWLDLVAVRYSAMVNGATSLALTMLDVLAGMGPIRVCVGYRVDGKVTERFVPDGARLARVEPVYEEMAGFEAEVGGAKKMAELPEPARRFVRRIEEFVGVPAGLVSVGPGREQTIRV